MIILSKLSLFISGYLFIAISSRFLVALTFLGTLEMVIVIVGILLETEHRNACDCARDGVSVHGYRLFNLGHDWRDCCETSRHQVTEAEGSCHEQDRESLCMPYKHYIECCRGAYLCQEDHKRPANRILPLQAISQDQSATKDCKCICAKYHTLHAQEPVEVPAGHVGKDVSGAASNSGNVHLLERIYHEAHHKEIEAARQPKNRHDHQIDADGSLTKPVP